MKKRAILPIISISLCLWISGCKEKSDVQVLMPPKLDPSVFTVVRVNANLLQQRPKTENDLPTAILMMNQGDQIMVLESQQNWSKVQHIISGRIGWLNNGFIQVENRSRWWSGDTDKARNLAERLYKEKIFMERNWPVIHINIEERWNKLVLTLPEDQPFDRDQAVECALFAMDHLTQTFPEWRDHQVFLDGVQNGQKYTLVMSDDKKPVFL